MKKVLVALCCVAFFASCKKEESVSKTDILLAHGWSITKVEAVVAGITQDATAELLESCTKDDVVTFAAGNKWSADEGASKCTPDAPQTATGTWAFDSNETKFSKTEDGQTTTYDITSIKPGSMVLSASEDFLGIKTTIRYTYSKK
jgi:hypothetical protein